MYNLFIKSSHVKRWNIKDDSQWYCDISEATIVKMTSTNQKVENQTNTSFLDEGKNKDSYSEKVCFQD